MAEDIGDESLFAQVMWDKTWHHHHFMQTVEGVETGRRAEHHYRSTESLYEMVDVQGCIQTMQLPRAEFADIARQAPELERLADRVGHVSVGCFSRLQEHLSEALTTGDLGRAATALQEELDRQRQVGFGFLPLTLNGLGTLFEWRGDLEVAEAYYREAATMEPQCMFTHTFTSAYLLARVHAGDSDAIAKTTSIEVAARLGEANLVGEWEQVLNVVEGRAFLRERASAASLYPLVVAGLDTGVVMSWNSRLWQMVAGIAAACGEQWDAAREHFETALKQAHELPHKVAQPETRRWYAQTLIDRNAAGDRDKARTLLGEATEMYRAIGMQRHLEMAERMATEL